MSLNLRIIEASEADKILEFEQKRLQETIVNEADRTFAAWHARWRKESLEHYLKLGWSFLALDQDNQLVGYFLGQPLLFFDGQTQSLWIEHLQSSSLQARDALTDLAYRLAREKHFQRVYFPNQPHIQNSIRPMKPEDWASPTLFLKTTKV
ncbi:MAG: hypothetical protein KF681_15330 [Bdellovibrionaceae bacterium]|nr:hypothetical protein [Pseudobdellovibrionaceae bacterium]